MNSDVDQFNVAVYCFEIAAKAGNAAGQAGLSSTYLHDLGGRKNLEQAEYWSRKAADQGNLDGVYGLGVCCFHKKDYENAEYWLQKAVDGGHQVAADSLKTLKELKNLMPKNTN